MAEAAGERAADLARNAQRSAIRLGNVDRFDFRRALARAARRQPQQPFARAVLGDLLGCDFRPRQREARVEFRAQTLCDVGEREDVLRAARIYPVPELRRAHLALARRNARKRQRIHKLRLRHARKRGFHRGRGGGVRLGAMGESCHARKIEDARVGAKRERVCARRRANPTLPSWPGPTPRPSSSPSKQSSPIKPTDGLCRSSRNGACAVSGILIERSFFVDPGSRFAWPG